MYRHNFVGRLQLEHSYVHGVDLVDAGADLIQTDGGTSARPFSAGSLGLIKKAAPTLPAAHSISSVSPVPVLCASGLSTLTVPMEIAAGASEVDVGFAVNRVDIVSMMSWPSRRWCAICARPSPAALLPVCDS